VLTACVVKIVSENQWRSQKFSTGGASICSIPSYPSLLSYPIPCRPTIKKRHDMNRLYEQLHVTGH